MASRFAHIQSTQRAQSLQKIQELLIQGRAKSAHDRARQMLSDHPADPDLRLLLASSIAQLGNKVAAMTEAEASLKLNPNHVNTLHMLGLLYVDFKLYELALPVFRRALDIAPQSHLIHWALGVYYLTVSKGDTAQHHLELSLKYVKAPAEALAIKRAMFECLVSQNKIEDAVPYFEELRRTPEQKLDAIVRMASVRKAGSASEIGQDIEHELASDAISAEQRSNLLLALGGLFENDKNFDRAFSCWQDSRNLLGVSKFNNERLLSALAWRKEFYSKELFAKVRSFGNESNVPVFVVGMPRSGTTLAEQVIAAHPIAAGVGELDRMDNLEPAFLEQYGRPTGREALFQNASQGELKARGDETLQLLQSISRPGAKRIVEKTPQNYMYVGYLALCFPNAKIIHCRRHPADTFISAYQNRMTRAHDYAYAQDTYAQAYLLQEKYREHWNQVIPEKIIDVTYENMTGNFESEARRIINFIGLDWSDQCLKFFESNRTINTFSSQQARQSVTTSSVGRWTNYERHIGELFATLGKANYIYKIGH